MRWERTLKYNTINKDLYSSLHCLLVEENCRGCCNNSIYLFYEHMLQLLDIERSSPVREQEAEGAEFVHTCNVSTAVEHYRLWSWGLSFHTLLRSYIRWTFLWFAGRCKLLTRPVWNHLCHLSVNIYYLLSLGIRRSSFIIQLSSKPQLVIFRVVFYLEALQS